MDLEYQRHHKATQTKRKVMEEAKEWLRQITGKSIDNFFQDLQNGVTLCELMNHLFPGIIPQFVVQPKHPLEVRENINAFLEACYKIGVPHQDLITLLDMGQRPDESQLLHCLSAIQRQAQALGCVNLPSFGPTYYRTIEDQQRIEERRKQEAIEWAKKREREDRRNLARRTELEGQKLEKRQRKIDEAKETIASRQQERTANLAMHGSVIGLSDLGKMEGSTIKYGYDLEIAEKNEAKKDPQLEMDILDWIEDVTGEVVDHIWLHLKSGRKLCKLANRIRPGIIPRINQKKIAIMERENIQLFLNACVGLGVSPQDLFEVDNLYKATNLQAVLHTLYCLAVTTNKNSDWHRNSLREEAPVHPTEESPKQLPISIESESEKRKKSEPFPHILENRQPQAKLPEPEEGFAVPIAPPVCPEEANPVPVNNPQSVSSSRTQRPPAPLPPLETKPRVPVGLSPVSSRKQPSQTTDEARYLVPVFRDSAHRNIVEGKPPPPLTDQQWATGLGVTLLLAAPVIGVGPLLVGGVGYLAYNAYQYYQNK